MRPEINDPFWDKVLAQKPKAKSLALRLILDKATRGLSSNSITSEDAKREILVFFDKYKKLGEQELDFLRTQIN